MKITKFLNIDIEPAPPELELEIEMQCREIMKANDIDNVKRYCTHMVRKKFYRNLNEGYGSLCFYKREWQSTSSL